MTMMTRMISAATQLTLLLSAFGGYPVAFKASANFGGSQPSIVMVPIFVTISLPGTAGTDVNDRPTLPGKALVSLPAGGRAHERQGHVLVVRISHEASLQRRLGALALRLHPPEQRRLVQFEPDVDGHQQQRD